MVIYESFPSPSLLSSIFSTPPLDPPFLPNPFPHISKSHISSPSCISTTSGCKTCQVDTISSLKPFVPPLTPHHESTSSKYLHTPPIQHYPVLALLSTIAATLHPSWFSPPLRAPIKYSWTCPFARGFTSSLARLSVILSRFSVLWAQVALRNPHEQDFKGRKQRNCPREKEIRFMASLRTIVDQEWLNRVNWGQNQLFF